MPSLYVYSLRSPQFFQQKKCAFRLTNGSIEYRLDGEIELHSIPLRLQPIPELLAYLVLEGCDWTWGWDTSQGMNIAIIVAET